MKTDSRFQRLYLWRRAWEECIAPLLSTRALVALRDGLRANDARLITNRIVSPTRNDRTTPMAPLGACPIGYCGWQGEGLTTCEEVENFFGDLTFRAAALATERNSDVFVSDFVIWWDVTPREFSVPALLWVVEVTLAARNIGGAA